MIAEAERDRERFAAEAEAFRKRSIAKADADANVARADSLRAGNQELIAAERIVESLPAIVEAAARSLAGANLTVLNGAQGVNDVVAGLVGQGLTILDLLKKATAMPANAASGANGAGAEVVNSSAAAPASRALARERTGRLAGQTAGGLG